MKTPPESTHRGFFAGPAGWVFCGFAAIALFFLVAEHRAHLGLLIPYVPLALLGVCVVLHSYMHGAAHGHRPGSDAPTDDTDAARREHDHTHTHS